jgi:hypothetical protein
MTQRAYRGHGAPTRDAINVLDCVFCGSWFPAFDLLAAHVKRIHPDGNSPAAKHQARKDRYPMAKNTSIPASKRAAKTATSGSGRIPSANRDGGGDFNPFLRADVIGRAVGNTAIATLTGQARVVDGQFGTQIMAEVRIAGDLYDWPVKLDSANHAILEDVAGTDPAKWRGKKITLTVKEYMGKHYVAAARPKAARR